MGQWRKRKLWSLTIFFDFLRNGAHSAPEAGHIYKLPGSNHAFICGEVSNDSTWKLKYVNTVIQNASTSVDMANVKRGDKQQVGINQYPRCFVSDAENVQFILDTGSNHTIIKDASNIQG